VLIPHCNGISPEGVIILMPDTETGIPNHEEFAKDLAFLCSHFYDYSLNSENDFYNSVRNDYFIMGHSMGAGASHLASSYDYINPLAVITFAAAETDPSAAEAVTEFTGKVVMFIGENDLVTPFEEHQEPIYNNSASTCKTLISIIGGVHCFFNDYSFTCDIGENNVGSDAQISREEQQQVVLDFVSLLVKSEMYNDDISNNNYLDSLENSNRINVTRDCSLSFINMYLDKNNKQLIVYPNPAKEKIFINYKGKTAITYAEIYNVSGSLINTIKLNNNYINIQNLKAGEYLLFFPEIKNSEKIYLIK